MSIPVSIGNQKLGKDTAIFNMCSATDCPSKKLGLCQVPDGRCYAHKAEVLYPNVLPYRRRQAEYWKANSAVRIVSDLARVIRKQREPIRFLRLNESGDFDTIADIEKLEAIAEMLFLRYGIRSYLYTARKDLIKRRKPQKHLIISGSGFMVDNQFTCVPKDYKRKPGEVWCKSDCRKCGYCKSAGKRKIINKLH